VTDLSHSLVLAVIGEGRGHDLHCDGNLKELAAKAALSGAAQLLRAAVNSNSCMPSRAVTPAWPT
jgi:hypothetical protein